MLDHPVVFVPQDYAVRFCAWLTTREQAARQIPADASYTLPTFAQWQAVARSVRQIDDAITDRAWAPGQAQPTEPVRWGEPSALGLYGLFGNVFEWCLDRAAGKVRHPDGKEYRQEGGIAVGGGWASTRDWLREQVRQQKFGRIWCPRGWPMRDGGFRLWLTVGPKRA
jgi:formylglycine-generating enzyme required for sulfatase activity